jgi:glucoamylase
MLAKAFLTTVATVATLGFSLVSAEPIPRLNCRDDLEDFITKQKAVSIAGVLANIGPDGSEARGVPAGIVVASPSRQEPDCKYCASKNSMFFANEINC